MSTIMSVFCSIENKFIWSKIGMEYVDAVFRMEPQNCEKTDERTIKEYERLQEESRSCKGI
jgi:hypothetical protein